MYYRTLIIPFLFVIIVSNFAQDKPVYLDTNKPIEERVHDLISRLTLEEKVSQMVYNSPAIPRLNIHEYNWWNECLHGVARSGAATVFPQTIGLGATFDEELMIRIGTAISDEARAMYNAAIENGYRLQYGGLTFWTPNINIFRDPRWGRGQETYGEDPFLTGTLAAGLVKGLQGDHPKYLKVAACAKHYAVHSGPEKLRHEFNAVCSQKDLFETYLPAFKKLMDSGVESVMCAYNQTNGEPCCAHNYLLNDVLRNEWGFKGHVVSDCGALVDFYKGHKIVANEMEAAALALKSGVNLNCGRVYPALVKAVEEGLVDEKDIDESLAVLWSTRFKLGLFDPEENVPYNHIPYDVINCQEHRQLAYTAAVKSVVLLKNNGVLPLKNDLSKYFLTGPLATSIEALIGNYHGVSGNMTTIFEGLASKIETGSQLLYIQGCLLDRDNKYTQRSPSRISASSDATFVVLGLTGLIEGEEGSSIASEYAGDRLDYNIPENQMEYLKRLRQDNTKPIITILTGGSPMNLSEIHELSDAVLLAWYPGEEGGNAVADIIFGNVSPSGRLPITFPKSLDQLPPYEDYSMEGRTYRYMKEEPMYPFGYGLTYGKFEYTGAKLVKENINSGDSTILSVDIKNTGQMEAEEVVQLYITDVTASVRVPLFSLKGFKRVYLTPGEIKILKFTITSEMLSIINNEGEAILEKGDFKIFVGGSLPVKRSLVLGGSPYTEVLLKVNEPE